jgi:hypothetical protein
MVRSRVRTALVWVLCLVCLEFFGGEARAAIESDLVQRGVAAYNDLQYARAITLLHQALEETLTREEKLVTFQTLAFAHVALNDAPSAQRDFEDLLRIDAGFELDRTISPRVRSVFESARARFATGQDGTGGALTTSLPTVTPRVDWGPTTHAQPGHALTVQLSHPGGVAARAQLFYRTRGQAVFSSLSAPAGAQGHFFFTLPGEAVQAPAFEYYLVILDDSGASVAQAGTLAQPLVVDVPSHPKPLYAKPWFWGVAVGAAVVAAGIVTASVLAADASKSNAATIVIHPTSLHISF